MILIFDAYLIFVQDFWGETRHLKIAVITINSQPIARLRSSYTTPG